MTLSRKIFLLMMGLFSVVSIILIGVATQVNRQGFNTLVSDFEHTMAEMNNATEHSIEEMHLQSARDLVGEIKIAIGESLQPGES